MSHAKERKEKNCLNCDAIVHDRYCSHCGQENLEPQETTRQLLLHFFSDITHFDGKFFSTLKHLIFRPGFLTKEYVMGRRAAYLNPIRMYLFTSFIFFLVFFSISGPEDRVAGIEGQPVIAGLGKDSAMTISKKEKILDTLIKKDKQGDIDVNLGPNTDYRDEKEYDSLRRAGIVHDNFIQRWIVSKQLKLDKKYGKNNGRLNEEFQENLLHSLPQMFFFLLPLLAVILQLLYIRRKRFYYVAHAIFTVHFFTFIFITRLFMYAIAALSKIHYLGWLFYIDILIGLGILYYGYRAMHIFYEQGRGKTLLKYFLLLLSFIVLLVFVTLIMSVYSFYKL